MFFPLQNGLQSHDLQMTDVGKLYEKCIINQYGLLGYVHTTDYSPRKIF